MRGPFLYISTAKLASIATPRRGWWRRITGVNAGVPGASVGLSVAPEAASWPRTIETIEQRLTAEGRVASAHAAAVEEAGGLFGFEGHAAILAAEGAYWLATITDDAAILLVGSLGHAIGAPPAATDTIFPPSSADPRSAIEALLEGADVGAESAAGAWEHVARYALGPAGRLSDLPRVRGIADYRNRSRLDRSGSDALAGLAGHDGPLAAVVVGSPLWVESN